MPDVKVPIVGGDKVADDTDYYDALPVNLYAVMRDVLGSKGYLYSHDGLDLFGTGQGIDRGGFYSERMLRHFRVSGQKLVEVAASGVSVLGDISGINQAVMACSFNTLLVVADGNAYLFDGSTLSQITDGDLGFPISATWIDGYYVFTDGEYIYHTDISSESSIDPLKFATSEISPDRSMAVGRTQDDLLIVFNRYSTEYFINAANEQFAFTRLTQKAINYGIVGPRAWTQIDGTIFMLGSRKSEGAGVHALGVGQVLPVSTRTIEKVIGQYTDSELYTAVVESRTSDRDKLVYVHLPNETLLFNHTAAEKMGPESAWSILKTGQSKWRGINGVFDPNLKQWFFGDKLGANIGTLNPKSAAQFGDSVHSEFYSPLIPIDSASVDELEIKTVSGFCSESVNFFVSTTRDGASFSSEWSQEIAAPYQYGLRYIVRRLGYVRNHIGFKFRGLHKDKINVSGLMVRYG